MYEPSLVVTVIIALPSETPVITPFDTVATDESDVDHFKSLSEYPSGKVGITFCASP